jgi:hypothetical protein
VKLSERVVVQLTDCEQVRVAGLAQPVNAVSSIAYLAGGAYVLGRLGALGRAKRLRAIAAGSAVALNGIGSIAYHGWPSAWTHWLHDIAIVAFLATPVAIDLGRFRGWTETKVVGLAGGVTAAGGAVLYAAPTSTNVLTTGLAAVAMGLEIATAVAARRQGRVAFPARATTWVAGVALGLAALGNAAGRTGSPLCEPESLLQGHAVWHALGAAFMAAFSVVVLDRPDDLVVSTPSADHAGRT